MHIETNIKELALCTYIHVSYVRIYAAIRSNQNMAAIK